MMLLAVAAIADAQIQRKQAIDPPGFMRINVAGKDVSCSPDDQAWIRRALSNYQPPAAPSTMPTELLTRINDRRDDLTRQMVHDLALPSEKFVSPLFDATLVPQLQRLSQFKVPFVYLVTTRNKLKQALLSGWVDARYAYNKATEEITYNDSVQLSTDRSMDDALLWIEFNADDSFEDKSKKLIDGINGDDQNVDMMVWGRGNQMVQLAFGSFIGEKIISSLNLNEQQKWLGYGLASVLAAKYTSDLIGIPYEEILSRTVSDAPNSLIKAEQLDLLNPIPLTSLQPEYREIYEDAFRRRSTQVVDKLLKAGGPDTAPKLLQTLRKKTATDGQGLVKQIEEATKVDVFPDLAPQR